MNSSLYFIDISRVGMLLAALLNFILIAYAFGKASSTPLRNSFIVAIGINALYLFGAGVAGMFSLTNEIRTDVGTAVESAAGSFVPTDPMGTFWLHFCWVFIYLLPIGYLYFYYVLANRKRDQAFHLIGFICIMIATISLFNRKLVFKGEWNFPVMAFIFLPCMLYGVSVCAQTWWNSQTKMDSMRNGIVLVSMFVPTVLYLVCDLIMTQFLGKLQFSIMYIHALNGIIVPLMISIAVTRYGLLKMDLSYAAEGMFLNSEDPALLVRPNKTIARANPIAQKLFGIAEFSQVKDGTTIKEIIPQYDESKQNFTTTILTNEKESIYSCSNSQVRVENAVCGQLLMLRDITKETELNSMKTEFTSTVSHELRTPLTSILGFARIIEKRLKDVIVPRIQFETKKQQRAAKQVQNNLMVVINEGQRLTQLINDVLDISKMEAGKLEWKFQRVHISEVLEKIVADFRPPIEEKGLDFQTDIPNDLPVLIADPMRIEQVLSNILQNSLKFTANGRIQLEACHIGGKLLLSIKDTGIGIEENDMDSIFQKYQQVGDVLTDKPTGSGLGLPIASEIIDSHGGKIKVKSIVDIGTRFQIELPLPVSERKEAEIVPLSKLIQQWKQTKIAPPVENPNTILIIEDEAHIREMLRQALEPAGFDVWEAQDGLEGIEWIRKQCPSLVILDVMMPRLNGFEVVTLLKNNPQTIHVPIMMLTVLDEVQRGYGLGVDRYIKKPIEPEQIVKEVQNVLSHKDVVQTTLFLGSPGYGSDYLQQLLIEQGQTVMKADNLSAFQQQLSITHPEMVLVEAEAFSYEEVYVVLNQMTLTSKLLVKFVSNE